MRGVELRFLKGFYFVVVFINTTLLGAFSGGTVVEFTRQALRWGSACCHLSLNQSPKTFHSSKSRNCNC